MADDPKPYQQHPAMHASAPEGMKCADCTMGEEPCSVCYEIWWRKKNPNVIHTEEIAVTRETCELCEHELLKECKCCELSGEPNPEAFSRSKLVSVLVQFVRLREALTDLANGCCAMIGPCEVLQEPSPKVLAKPCATVARAKEAGL